MAKIGTVIIKKKKKQKKAAKKVFSHVVKSYPQQAATLGDGAGNVVKPGRAGYVFARTSGNHDLVICINKRVPNKNNLKVWIGFSPEMPTALQVLGIRTDPTNTDTPEVGPHHQLHEWGKDGADVTYIYGEQFMPWMVKPDGGMVVRAYRGVAQISGTYQYLETQTLDLTGYRPPTGSVYALIGFVGNNTLQVRTSATRSDRSQLTFSDIPSFGDNFFPLVVVALDNNATELTKSYYRTDFLDVRFLGYAMNSDKLDGREGNYYSNPANLSGTFVSIRAITTAPSPIAGMVQLVSGTASVNTTVVTTGSRIFLTHQNSSGTVGIPYVNTITAGVGFSVASSNVFDNSFLAWLLVESG